MGESKVWVIFCGMGFKITSLQKIEVLLSKFEVHTFSFSSSPTFKMSVGLLTFEVTLLKVDFYQINMIFIRINI